ncbi:hypothetical protein C8Q74DRAFT_307318 [Fomes fomentarius]|nr:hypothetical protein C8Q74DRAFT_307318 [Fomes fomentarius]
MFGPVYATACAVSLILAPTPAGLWAGITYYRPNLLIKASVSCGLSQDAFVGYRHLISMVECDDGSESGSPSRHLYAAHGRPRVYMSNRRIIRQIIFTFSCIDDPWLFLALENFHRADKVDSCRYVERVRKSATT